MHWRTRRMTRTIDPASICRQLNAADQRARDLVAGLTEDQARWRPAPGSASILDCLLGMRSAARKALVELDAGIARSPRARPSLGASRSVGRLWTLFLRTWETVPCRGRDDTPAEVPAVRDVLTDLLGTHLEVRGRLAAFFRRDLEFTRMSLPATPWVRLPLGVGLA